MWFVEIEPAAEGAAAVSIGLEGDDELVVSLPHTCWELWRPSALEALASDLDAIFAGRVEESGSDSKHSARLLWPDGTVRRIRRTALFVPWRRHRSPYRSTYCSYGAVEDGD